MKSAQLHRPPIWRIINLAGEVQVVKGYRHHCLKENKIQIWAILSSGESNSTTSSTISTTHKWILCHMSPIPPNTHSERCQQVQVPQTLIPPSVTLAVNLVRCTTPTWVFPTPCNASPSRHQARRISVFREGETTSGSTKAPLGALRKKIVKEVKVRATLRSKYNFREKKPEKSSLVCWSQQGPGRWHSLLTLLERRNQAKMRDWKHPTMKRWAKTMRMGTAASDL